MALRPQLRPGSIVLRHDAKHLRVGLSPGILVRDRPDLVSFLPLLDGVRDVDTLRAEVRRRSLVVGEVDALVRELLSLGVAIDSAASPDPSRPVPVRVLAVDRHTHALAHTIRTVCGEPRSRRVDAQALAVAVCTAEPSRDALDDLVDREGAVLVVRLDEDRVLVGPLVVAGRSPCLRCADLHRADADPTWPLVLAQLEQHAGPPVAPRTHRRVAWQAALLVAAEAERWQQGERPASLGAVGVLGPHPDDQHVQDVPFHPRCLCAVFPGG